MTVTKKQVQFISGAASSHWVGDGFPVRTLLPARRGVDVSPFLMLDYAGPANFEPAERPRGVEEHPHRGFETVTIAYQGSVDHRDSGGNAGTVHPGDVQWMTAASGVVHEEKHGREFTANGGTFEMVQLWVNLPAKDKMSPPKYQGIESAGIPNVKLDGESYGRVIAGNLNGVAGAASTFTPVNVFDLRLVAGTTSEISIPEGHNASVVLLRGDITLGDDKDLAGEALIAQLSTDGAGVSIRANADSIVLLLSGEPLREPVASYGPFVMNTEAELRQAFEDYRAGRMGRLG